MIRKIASRFRKTTGTVTIFAVCIGLILFAAGVARLSNPFAPEANDRKSESNRRSTVVFDLTLLPGEERLAYRTIAGKVTSIGVSDTSGDYDGEDLSPDEPCFDVVSASNGECLMLVCPNTCRVHFPRRPHADLAIDIPRSRKGYSFAVSPDAQVGAVQYAGDKIILQSLLSGMKLGTVSVSHENYEKPFVVHSQGALCICFGHRIEFWQFAPDGRSTPQFTDSVHSDFYVSFLQISDDGKRLVVCGSAGELTVWDLVERKVLWQWNDATHRITSVMASSTDRWLVVVNPPRTVDILDFKTGKRTAQLTIDADLPERFQNNLTGCVFSRQADLLYVADSKGVIRVLTVPELIEVRRLHVPAS